MDNLPPHGLKEEEIFLTLLVASIISSADAHFWTAVSRILAHSCQIFQYFIQALFLQVRTDPLQLACPGRSLGAPTSEVQPIMPLLKRQHQPQAKLPAPARCSAPLPERHWKPNFLVQLSHAHHSAKVAGY